MRTRFLALGSLLFTLLLSLVFFSGCQSSETEEGITIDDVPLDRRIGVISSLGNVKTSSQGTHLLKLDDGDTILLKSLSINLDDEKYSKAAVEVRGVLIYTKGDKPLMEVQNIDILEDYVLEDTKAPKWETYAGALFRIDYRDDFEVEKDSDSVTFTKRVLEDEESLDEESTQEVDEEDALKDVVSIISTARGEDEDLLTFLDLESNESSDLLAKGLTKSKVGVQDLPAYKKVESETSDITFYVEGDANFYTLAFDGSEHDDALKMENLFYEMLASFELIDASSLPDEDFFEDDVIDSRTLELDGEEDFSEDEDSDSTEEPDDIAIVEGYEEYASDSFDFTVQYPKSWYFEGSAGGSGVIRHYGFGDEPLDESSADISLDLLSTAESGESVSYGGKQLTKVKSGSSVEIYFEGGSRVYRLSGPASQESVLLQMASSISEN